jgi:predicted permease
MKTLRSWALRITGVFSKQKREQEFAAEIEAHVQMQVEDNLRAGIPLDEARRAALVKLGGLEQAKQAYRERGTMPILESLVQDFRFALRQFVKNPGFACVAVLILALGMGASIAIFTFVDATLLKALPYWKPDRLACVTETAGVMRRANLSYADYLDWKSRNDVLSSFGVWNQNGYMFSTREGVQLAMGARVSDGFFKTLGVTPILGRDFHDGEDLPSAPRAVMLSHDTWQKRFGARREVVGQAINLSGDSYTIVGVLPGDFQFALAGTPEFWTALHADGPCEKRRSCHNLTGIGRLKDGVSLEKARNEMAAIATQLEQQYPDSNRGQGAFVEPLREVIVGDVRPILLVLLAGAALLLVIACVNVTSLLLVRSERRRRELAVRGAMGASRTRLVCQFAVESFLLVSMGTALGLASAAVLVRALLSFISKDVMKGTPFLQGLRVDSGSVAFAGYLALFCLVLFSLAPALRFARSSDLRDELAEGSRTAASTVWRRFASNLVVLELALAVILLAVAGLLGKSFYRLLHVDIGFEPDHLATVRVVRPSDYETDKQKITLVREIVSRVAALPGVKSVGVTSRVPVSSNGNTKWIRVVGHPYNGEHNEVNEREVSAEYFQTMQARLVRGRFFTDAEDESKPNVVIINQALARKYFQGEDPIGKQIGDNLLTPKSLAEVVGIVEDVKEGALDEEIWPAVYFPFNQGPDDFFILFARTDQAEQALLPAMISAIQQVAPGIATYDEATMNQRIYNSPSAYLHRSSAWLIGGFAVLSLLLGAVGLYGVIAYSVSQRTREIGVRMALGAQRRSVYRLIMGEAGRLTGLGIAAGLVCSLAAATLIRKLLFGVRAWDVTTLVAVSVVLSLTALAASYIPARRAASVNPVEALRSE